MTTAGKVALGLGALGAVALGLFGFPKDYDPAAKWRTAFGMKHPQERRTGPQEGLTGLQESAKKLQESAKELQERAKGLQEKATNARGHYGR